MMNKLSKKRSKAPDTDTAGEKAAREKANFESLITDLKIKVYLTENASQCKETLARLVFVLTAGTDIGILYQIKDPKTRLMHSALTAVVKMCLRNFRWQADLDTAIYEAVVATLEVFNKHPEGTLEALNYAMFLSSRVTAGTIQMADIASAEIFNT